MKKQLFSIALLVSVAGTMGAMQNQPLTDFNGPVKSVVCSPGSIIVTLHDGTQRSLSKSIQWNLVDGVIAPMSAQPVIAPVVPTAPKAPAIQPAPKVPAVPKMKMVFRCAKRRCGRR